MPEKPPQQQIAELRELLIVYFKQETVEPLTGLLRWVGFGLLGATFLGAGVCFLAIGLLRALQTQTGTTFHGNWSWAPYAITVAVLLVVAGAALTRTRSPRS